MINMNLTTLRNMTNDELINCLSPMDLFGIERLLLNRLEEANKTISSLNSDGTVFELKQEPTEKDDLIGILEQTLEDCSCAS